MNAPRPAGRGAATSSPTPCALAPSGARRGALGQERAGGGGVPDERVDQPRRQHHPDGHHLGPSPGDGHELGDAPELVGGPEHQAAAPFAKLTLPASPVAHAGIPEFQAIGAYVGRQVMGALAGKPSVDKALADSQAFVERIMAEAGYYKT